MSKTVLSPLLFNLYSEAIFQEEISEEEQYTEKSWSTWKSQMTMLFLQTVWNHYNTYQNGANKCIIQQGLEMKVKKTKFMVITKWHILIGLASIKNKWKELLTTNI